MWSHSHHLRGMHALPPWWGPVRKTPPCDVLYAPVWMLGGVVLLGVLVTEPAHTTCCTLKHSNTTPSVMKPPLS